MGGSLIERTVRLKNIKTYVQAALVRDYELVYETGSATERSRLIGVTEKSATSAYPSFVFDWQDWTHSGTYTTYQKDIQGNFDPNKVWRGDFTGDGRSDLVSSENGWLHTHIASSSGNGTFTRVAFDFLGGEFEPTKTWIGDFNGDGLTDLVSHENQKFHTYFSTGNGGYTVSHWTLTGGFDATETWLGDYDGDGRTDILTKADNGFYTYFSNGNGTYQKTWTAVSGSEVDGTRVWAGDFNGDKITDLLSAVAQTGGGGTVWYFSLFFFNGDGTYEHPALFQVDGAFPQTFSWVGDYNGDGLSDIMKKTSDPTDHFNTYLSKGDGTFEYVYTAIPGGAWDGNDVWLGDLNGDKLTDLVSSKGGNFNKYFSNGDGTFGHVQFAISGQWEPLKTWTGDFNGDGLMDLVSVKNNDFITRYGDGPFPDLVTSVTNPFGGSFSVTYKPLTDENIYDKGTDAVYPSVDLQTSFYAVSDHTTSDGLGETYDFAYQYGGLKVDLEGRGSLGMRFIHAIDLSAGKVRSTVYAQEFPFTGILENAETARFSDEALFEKTINTWSSREVHTGVFFATLDVIENLECDGQAASESECRKIKRTMTYDNFGNNSKIIYDGDVAVIGDEAKENIGWAINEAEWLMKPLDRLISQLDGGAAGAVLRRTDFYYDNLPFGVMGSQGLVTSEHVGHGILNQSVTTHTYDAFGNRKTTTDPIGCVTSWDYDTTYQTFPVQETTCLTATDDAVTTFSWDPLHGRKVEERDPNNQLTEFFYDDFGRLTHVIDPLGSTTYPTIAYDYTDWGTTNVQSIRTFLSSEYGTTHTVWKRQQFDGLGRNFKSIHMGPVWPQRIQTIREYDSRGLVVSALAPNNFKTNEPSVWTGFVYDVLGRLTQVLNADNTTVTTTYDRGTVTVTNERGKTRTSLLDGFGRRVKVTEHTGSVTDYTYDSADQLIGVVDDQGYVTTTTYEARGRKLSVTDPNTGHWVYQYDDGGNVVSQTDAKNQTITMTYDLSGRIKTKVYPNGGGTITWTYDDPAEPFSKGRLTKVQDLSGETHFEYDTIGRIAQETKVIDGISYTAEQTYNPMDQVRFRTLPDGAMAEYRYDSAGWLKFIHRQGSIIQNITYNGPGQILQIDYGNGRVSTRSYHPDNFRLTGLVPDGPSGNLQNLSYLHDPVGNITDITDSVRTGTRDFEYDDLDRLTQASGTFGGSNQAQTTEDYVYDSIGRLQSKAGVSYTYGDSNHPSAVTAAGSKTYAYDANGNMTSNNGVTYTWDAENQLVSAGGGLGFEYDYTGRRVKKITPAGTLIYPFSDYEIDPVGDRKTYLSVEGEIVGVTKRTASATERRYYHNDHLGGANLITDSGGLMAQVLEYDPWGRVSREDTLLDNVKKFTGQEFDPESGLYYYVGRYYEPELGRFISPDPFVQEPFNPQNLNRYAYVLNNPVKYTDPSGYFIPLIIGIIQVALGSIAAGAELAVLIGLGAAGVDAVNAGLLIAGLASIAQGAQNITAAATATASGQGGGATPNDPDQGDKGRNLREPGDDGVGREDNPGYAAVPISFVRFSDEDERAEREALQEASFDPFDFIPALRVAKLVFFAAKASKTAARKALDLLGRGKPRHTRTRTNTDLPGGRATAKSIFRHETKNERATRFELENGGIGRRTKSGKVIRLNPDGSSRVDLPRGPKGRETIHFRP